MASQKRPVAMVTGGTRGIGSGEVGLILSSFSLGFSMGTVMCGGY